MPVDLERWAVRPDPELGFSPADEAWFRFAQGQPRNDHTRSLIARYAPRTFPALFGESVNAWRDRQRKPQEDARP